MENKNTEIQQNIEIDATTNYLSPVLKFLGFILLSMILSLLMTFEGQGSKKLSFMISILFLISVGFIGYFLAQFRSKILPIIAGLCFLIPPILYYLLMIFPLDSHFYALFLTMFLVPLKGLLTSYTIYETDLASII